MQNKKIFKTWSCVRFCAPSVLYNYQSGAEAPKPDAAEKAKTQEPTPNTTVDKTKAQGDTVLKEAKRTTEGLAALGGDKLKKMSPFEANLKLTKGLNYLSLKQNIPLDHEQLVNVLKDKGFLNPEYDSSEDLNALATTVNAIKAMQRKLGVKDDGEIGENTFAAMQKQQPDIVTALKQESGSKLAAARTEKPAERPDLPAEAKAKIEVKLSQVSDTLQMNYKTAANLYKKLFDADGKFIQPVNAGDLVAYKTALDNISGQLKVVETIENGLHDYKVPVDFTLTITNQHGETSSPRALVCIVHNAFGIPRANLFATDSGVGVARFFDYRKMQDNFEKRLTELKGDYDRIVNDWAKKLAGETGRTGDETMQARFDEMFEGERTPPVLALLGKKNEDFQGDVLDEAGTILAKRNAKEDEKMADAKAFKLSQQVVSAKTALDKTEKIATDAKLAANKADRIRIFAEKVAAAEADPVEKGHKEKLAQAAALRAIDLNNEYARAEKYAEAAKVVYAKAFKAAELAGVDVKKLTAPSPAGGAAAADKPK